MSPRKPKFESNGKVKKYEMWTGTRNFWCRGRIATGPNSKNLLIVFLLINVTNLLCLTFTWIDYVVDESKYFPVIFGVIIWLLVDYFLYKAATTDPGFIP